MKSAFQRLFGKLSIKGQHNQKRRLGAESLEDRRLMTVTPHGGGIMPPVQLQGKYYRKKQGNNATLFQQTGKLESYLSTLARGSYLDMLTNAGYGVGRGTQDAGRIGMTNPNKTQWLTDTQIRKDLQAWISNGTLKTPDSNRLFVVYVEPGVAILNDHDHNATSQKDFLGYHGAFAGRDVYGRAADVRYAVIAYPGGYNFSSARDGFRSDFDQLTEVTSHEVAEAVTDPDVNYKKLGWYDDAKNGEIGDLANQKKVYWAGYCVQLEVNKNDQLIAPSGWSYYNSNSTFSAPLASVSSFSSAPLTPVHAAGGSVTTTATDKLFAQLNVETSQQTVAHKPTSGIAAHTAVNPSFADKLFEKLG